MNEPTLHPNLAKLAAAYDEILERMSRGQLSTTAARSEIAQLEARDDQGVRWNIDPDSGEWVRKTALGDYEYDDAPPTYGYMTPDAFDYTQNPQAFNPADRLQVAAVNEHLEHAPSSLNGATRSLQPARTGGGLTAKIAGLAGPSLTAKTKPALAKVTSAPQRTKIAAAALMVALLTAALFSCSGGDDPKTDAPTAPATTQGADPDATPTGKSETRKQRAKKRRAAAAQHR